MVQVLLTIETAAGFAASLFCSCVGLVALAKFAIDLAQALRGEAFIPSSGGSHPAGQRGRLRTVAGLFALLATSAVFFWLSYALARKALALAF